MVPIKWRPKVNALTSPQSYTPLHLPSAVYGNDDIAARIALRNPIYNQGLGKGFLLELREEIRLILTEGGQASIEGLLAAQISLSGRLASVDDPLPPLEESLHIRINPSKLLLDDVRQNAQTERLASVEKVPVIDGTEDAMLELADVLNPIGLLRIKGEDLLFDRSVPGCGCLLEGTRSGSMAQSRYALISASEILLMPDIPSQTDPWNNEYRLTVTAQYTEHGSLRSSISRRMLRTPLAVTIGNNDGILSSSGETPLVTVTGGQLEAESVRVRIQALLDVQDGDLRLNLLDMREGGAKGAKVQVSANGIYTIQGYVGSDLTTLEITVLDYAALLQLVRQPYGNQLIDILDVSQGT